MRRNFIRTFVNAVASAMLAVAVMAIPLTAAERSQDITSARDSFKPDYSVYADFLELLVLDIGPSRHTTAGSKTQVTGTRIGSGGRKSSSLEGNRVMFHVLEDQPEIVELLSLTRQDLQNSVSGADLVGLNKDEKLAYWLNLHNITVLEQIAERYPIRKLKRLYQGTRKRPSLLDEKLITIADTKLSLRDIQNKVVEEWDNPLVIYGFYLGAIGTPDIRTKPYTSDRVWTQLEKNAKNFVNSVRGSRAWAKVLKVSDHYKLGARYFPNPDEDLKAHILQYMRHNKMRKLMKRTTEVRMTVNNWKVADLSVDRGVSSAFAASNSGRAGLLVRQGLDINQFVRAEDQAGTAELAKYPPHVQEMLMRISKGVTNQRKREYLQAKRFGEETESVTVEEIETDGNPEGDEEF